MKEAIALPHFSRVLLRNQRWGLPLVVTLSSFSKRQSIMREQKMPPIVIALGRAEVCIRTAMHFDTLCGPLRQRAQK